MTSPRQTLFSTLEQILSSDMTRVGALAGKAAMDAILYTEAGFALTTPRDVTLRGLDLNPGAGLSVDLDPGSLARFEVGAGSDASQYELGTLAATSNQVIAAADAVNPRVDLIHGTPAVNDTDSTVRNVLTLPARTVTPTAIDKTRDPDLTIAVATGTPGASPALPATPAGAVPLWYVFVPALAASLVDDNLIDARVQYQPWSLNGSRKLEGLHTGGLGTNFQVTTGQAYVNGALLDVTTAIDQSATSLFPAGSGALASNTEYNLYAIARGAPGNIVGKNVINGFIPVLSTITPNANGNPSAPLTYRPLFGISTALTITTSNALHLGGARTGEALTFLDGGAVSLSRDGLIKNATINALSGLDDRGGFAGIGNGAFTPPIWFREPKLSFVNVSTVNVSQCNPILMGVLGHFAGDDVGMGTVAPADVTNGRLNSEGAEAADTWYFVYLRQKYARPSSTFRGSMRDYVLRISSEAPQADGSKLTPETGFLSSEYIYCGSFYNLTSLDIRRFTKNNNQVIFDIEHTIASSAAVPVSPTTLTVTAIMPVSASIGYFSLFFQVNPTAGGSTSAFLDVFSRALTSPILGYSESYTAADGTDELSKLVVSYIPTAAAAPPNSTFLINQSGAGTNVGSVSVTVNQIGYLENISQPSA